MKTIAPRNDVTLNLHRLTICHEIDSRRDRFEVMNGKLADVEQNGGTRTEPCVDQVLDDLLLAIHRDRSSTGQLRHVDAMPYATEAQLDAVMDKAFTLQAL